MRQNIVVLGATGKVGRELIGQVAKHDVPELWRHENPTVVVGLVDSTHIAIQTGGFPKEMLESFARGKKRVEDLPDALSSSGLESGGRLIDMMQRLGYSSDLVYVDVTGAKESARDLHLQIIRDTQSKIVTANKNPIGRYGMEEYRELTKDPRRYQYSATTMAGLGAVPWISERATIQDHVQVIRASLSGTVGFITDELTKGEKLSDAIQAARDKGYTEPDFRDDLGGVDVGRKLTILAREAGFEVDFGDIALSSLLPDDYMKMSDQEACLARIEAELDSIMEERFKSARENGNTLRYVAEIFASQHSGQKPSMGVGLREVPFASDFGMLCGTENLIEVETGLYMSNKPYSLRGPGAGLDITASVLRRDLVNLQNHVKRF